VPTQDLIGMMGAQNQNVSLRYTPVRHTHVAIDDTFWAPRLRTNRDRTVQHIYDQLRRVGSIDAFRAGWRWPEKATEVNGRWQGSTTMFWDSDVGKWLEAAAHVLATDPDPDLDALLDQVIARIGEAQQSDGYLNTWFTFVKPQDRWRNLRDWHELYCAGHLIEAGVAHWEATGKRSLLDIVTRYADLIQHVFGLEPDQKPGYCGHPEIELALVRLAQATGERRYLELSRYFVDQRGQSPHYFDREARERGEETSDFWAATYEYNQAHAPVRDQHEVVGHAVRAVYLYSAMVDLAGIYDDAALWATAQRLWEHLTTTRMYVTGGIGTSRSNEGFTSDYDLPNESAYAETCASIGLIFWAQRMLRVACDRRYADIMELALYNGVLSSVSLDGTLFFYENPLTSRGTHHRQPWFGCPCCPPNLARLLASLGQYVYAHSDDEIVVHLFVGGSATFEIGGAPVTLHQTTNYPWDGKVTLRVEPSHPATFAVRIRIPGWCQDATATVNGEAVSTSDLDGGYLRVERTWQSGDTIALELPMPIETVYAHPDIQSDLGQVALRRGPLVYCLEQTDHADPLHRVVLGDAGGFTTRYEPDLLGGVLTISGEAHALDATSWQELYRTVPPKLEPCTIRAVPYYAWDNRAAGAMRVWLHYRAGS
jgi:uncharacterized protein